jgi:hypothetical protein
VCRVPVTEDAEKMSGTHLNPSMTISTVDAGGAGHVFQQLGRGATLTSSILVTRTQVRTAPHVTSESQPFQNLVAAIAFTNRAFRSSSFVCGGLHRWPFRCTVRHLFVWGYSFYETNHFDYNVPHVCVHGVQCAEASEPCASAPRVSISMRGEMRRASVRLGH